MQDQKTQLDEQLKKGITNKWLQDLQKAAFQKHNNELQEKCEKLLVAKIKADNWALKFDMELIRRGIALPPKTLSTRRSFPRK